jgi:hypothetical protein
MNNQKDSEMIIRAHAIDRLKTMSNEKKESRFGLSPHYSLPTFRQSSALLPEIGCQL